MKNLITILAVTAMTTAWGAKYPDQAFYHNGRGSGLIDACRVHLR